MHVAEVFEDEPPQWGLRGDPYLWRELKEYFKGVEMPGSSADLKVLIENAYVELTGHSLADRSTFVVDRFSHGGMSSGAVSPEFWAEEGIPLLVSRHAKP